MPIVKDPKEVEEIYDWFRERSACLINFCTESFSMTETILKVVNQVGIESGVKSLPIVIAFTGNYPYRPQSVNYTLARDSFLGFEAIMQSMKLFMSDASPYRNVRLMIHLDHAQPDADRIILEEGLDDVATVMYDCSAFSFEENVKMTAEFVEKTKNMIRAEDRQ